MTNEEAAAINDPMLGEESICPACAHDKGGSAAPLAVTFWIGTCIICKVPKSVTHVRDFGWPGGVRPEKPGRQTCSNCGEAAQLGEAIKPDGKGGWRHPSKCGSELDGFRVKRSVRG